MHSTSASLLERLAGGADPASWDRFVTLYTPLLMKWCRRLGLCEPDAADFTQDVFVILLQHLPEFRYDPSRSFRAWLKTVLMNVWRKHQRKAARAPALGGDPDLIPDTDPAQFVDEADHRDFLIRRALAVAKTDFEPATWSICWEFLVHDRPAAEVAVQFGVTENAVYLAKSRVLRHLRTELAGLLD
jgi:RNA polymerase sigma-70 factor (ECF subfamily)